MAPAHADAGPAPRPRAMCPSRPPSSALFRLAAQVVATHGGGPDAAAAMAAEIVARRDIMLLVTLAGGVQGVAELARQYLLDNARALGTVAVRPTAYRAAPAAVANKLQQARAQARQRQAALQATQAAIASSLMDSIRFGRRVLGDTSVRAVRLVARDAKRRRQNLALAEAVAAATCGAKPDVKIRDCLSEAELERIVASLGEPPGAESMASAA